MLFELKRGKDKDNGRYKKYNKKVRATETPQRTEIKRPTQNIVTPKEMPIEKPIEKPIPEVTSPNQTPSKNPLLDVGPGWLLKIDDWYKNGDSIQLAVTGQQTYLEKNQYWRALECSQNGQTTLIRIQELDELFIHGSFKKYDPLTIGINTGHLREIESLNAGRVSVDNILYDYKYHGNAVFMKGETAGLHLEFEYWEFEDKGGYWRLVYQLWADGTLHVTLFQRIHPRSIYVRRPQ